MIRKLLLTVCALLTCVSLAFAEANFRSVTSAKSATDDTVQFLTGSTNVLYTKSIDVKNVKNDNDIGILYKATGGGTIDLKLEVEQSFRPPTTEGSVDADYLSLSQLDTSITDDIWHLATIDTVVLTYMRFKVTGQGSNDTGTIFQIKISK